MNVAAAVADWLKGVQLLHDDECEGPTGDTSRVTLSHSATAYFANGVRVAQLLRILSPGGELSLDTLKELHTPVARLYNWNVLIPMLHAMGVEVDADMKVLIVAGDLDIVADVLEQLHGAGSGAGPAKPRALAPPLSQPPSAKDATSVTQFLAFCCVEQLGVSWAQAVEMARSPGHKALARQQGQGVHGEHPGAVRWFKLVFAHCKHLAALCAGDAAEAELALSAARGGLGSYSADVVLWCSRLLCRLAADLTRQGTQAPTLWAFFSRPSGGASTLLDAWRMHAGLRPDGALLPLVLHFSGEHLDKFFTSVLPRHLPAPGAYWSFTLELLPLLSGSEGTKAFVAQSGSLKFLLNRALQAWRTMSQQATKGLALEALATLWSLFARELQDITLETAEEAERLPRLPGSEAPPPASSQDAASVVLAELKRACRDPEFEVQLCAHMQLFKLLDQFAAHQHPVAPILFKVLAFSLIENHHEPVLRQFLARNMQHTLQQQPFIPVGVLLKPLVKQATLYGYSNCDFDFFLALAKHQRLGLRHALLLLQFLGKVCLNDALHGRVATIPFLVLVERFHDSEVLHDFLEIFCEQALSTLLPQPGQKKSADATSIRATLCIELVAKLLHLPHTALLRRVSPTVLKAAQEHVSAQGVEHPGLVALMHFADKNKHAASLLLPPPPADDLRQPEGDEPAFKVRPPEERGRAVPGKGSDMSMVSADEPREPPPEMPKPARAGKEKGGGGGYSKPARAEEKPAGGKRAPGPAPKKLRNEEGKASPPPKEKKEPPPLEPLEDDEEDKEMYEQEVALTKLIPMQAEERERKKLQEELRKIRTSRTKRRAKAKYDAKLKAAKDEARAAADPTKPKRAPPRKKEEPPKSAAEIKRERGQQRQKAEQHQRKQLQKHGGKLPPDALAALEATLAAAPDPNTVPIPPGYEVKAEVKEGQPAFALPPELGLAEGLSAALELLESVSVAALGVHVMQPVEAVQETVLRVVPKPKPPPGERLAAAKERRAARDKKASEEEAPKPPSKAELRRQQGEKAKQRQKEELEARKEELKKNPPPRKPRPKPKPPEEEPKKEKSPPKPRPSPPKPRPPPKPKPKPPPAEPKAEGEGEEGAKAEGEGEGKGEGKSPQKPKPKKNEPPKSDNPLRADVKKYQQEQERLKREAELNAKLEKRRKETAKKMEEYQAIKQAKKDEEKRLADEKRQAEEEEEKKKREKEKKRNEATKKKLAKMREEKAAAEAVEKAAAEAAAAEKAEADAKTEAEEKARREAKAKAKAEKAKAEAEAGGGGEAPAPEEGVSPPPSPPPPGAAAAAEEEEGAAPASEPAPPEA